MNGQRLQFQPCLWRFAGAWGFQTGPFNCHGFRKAFGPAAWGRLKDQLWQWQSVHEPSNMGPNMAQLIESSKLMLINWFRVATDNRFNALQFSLELAAFFVEMLPFNLRMQPNPILPGMKKCMYSAFLGYTCRLFSRNYCEICLYFQFVSYFDLPWSGQLCPVSFGICNVASWETHRAPIIPESYKASGQLHAVGLICGPFHYQVVPFEAKFVPLSPPKPIGFAAKVASTLYWAIQHQFLLVRFVKVPFF